MGDRVHPKDFLGGHYCDRLSHLELHQQPAVNHPWPFQGRKNRNNSDPQTNPESEWCHWHPRLRICSPVELSWLVRVQPPLIPFPLMVWEGQWGEADVPWGRGRRESGVWEAQSLNSELEKHGSSLGERKMCWLVLWPVVHMQIHHLCWRMCLDLSKRAQVESVSELESHL